VIHNADEANPGVVTAPAMTQARFAELMEAGDSVVCDLKRYRDLLEAGNKHMNLVGPASLPDFWCRHALDSAQLLNLAPSAAVWADLGSGAGLPGIVLAIFLKERQGAHVHLVESMTKRCRFLEDVCKELKLPATVHNCRAEELTLAPEIVTARACAPMVKLLKFAAPYFQRGARGLFLKGQDVRTELQLAQKDWNLNLKLYPSLSDSRGNIVSIERVTAIR
jgi:16S rRNA (guanine527-N7)-methyltransferase